MKLTAKDLTKLNTIIASCNLLPSDCLEPKKLHDTINKLKHNIEQYQKQGFRRLFMRPTTRKAQKAHYEIQRKQYVEALAKRFIVLMQALSATQYKYVDLELISASRTAYLEAKQALSAYLGIATLLNKMPNRNLPARDSLDFKQLLLQIHQWFEKFSELHIKDYCIAVMIEQKPFTAPSFDCKALSPITPPLPTPASDARAARVMTMRTNVLGNSTPAPSL